MLISVHQLLSGLMCVRWALACMALKSRRHAEVPSLPQNFVNGRMFFSKQLGRPQQQRPRRMCHERTAGRHSATCSRVLVRSTPQQPYSSLHLFRRSGRRIGSPRDGMFENEYLPSILLNPISPRFSYHDRPMSTSATLALVVHVCST